MHCIVCRVVTAAVTAVDTSFDVLSHHCQLRVIIIVLQQTSMVLPYLSRPLSLPLLSLPPPLSLSLPPPLPPSPSLSLPPPLSPSLALPGTVTTPRLMSWGSVPVCTSTLSS